MQSHVSPAVPPQGCLSDHGLIAKAFVDERTRGAVLSVDTNTGRQYTVMIGDSYIECVWLRGSLHHVRDADVESEGRQVTGVTHVGFSEDCKSFAFLDDDLRVLWFSGTVNGLVGLMEFNTH